MDLGLEGKIALVSAASQGLGLAIATRLAEEGATVILAARNPDRLRAAQDHIQQKTGRTVHIRPTDLTKPSDIQGLAQDAIALSGRLDILINNGGGPRAGRVADLEMTDWDQAYQQVMRSTIELTNICLPYLIATQGSIVNLSSYGVKQPIPDLLLSNAFRLGLIGWAKSLATDLAPKGVRVNTICPGWAKTDRVTKLLDEKARTSGGPAADHEGDIVKNIPMGRMGTPDEIADVAAFIASPRAAYVTGATIAVDGGIIQASL